MKLILHIVFEKNKVEREITNEAGGVVSRVRTVSSKLYFTSGAQRASPKIQPNLMFDFIKNAQSFIKLT